MISKLKKRTMSSSNPKKRNLAIIRSIFFALLASLALILILKYFGENLAGGNTNPTSYDNPIITNPLKKNKTQQVQLKYIPADYEMTINEEDAVAILNNPVRYRREFDNLVMEMNTSMLLHIGKRMGLGESQKQALLREYKTNYHQSFADLYYNDYIRARDTTSQLYETWYDNRTITSVDVFKEVASKYTCFLTQQVLANIIKTEGGSFVAQGRKIDTPCGIALTEALNPLIKKMEDRAAIEDFSRSKGLLQEKVEQAIAELATYEIDDKKGISSQQTTKFLGLNVSTSDVEVSAISKLKAGFKIDDYFNIDLNAKAKIVTITLPQPMILSHEVYPRFDRLDIGWMREVRNEDFNTMINALRGEFRREALEDDRILDKAKTRAISIMNTMFGPLVNSFNADYQLKVEFQNDQQINPEFPANKSQPLN